MMYNPVWGLKGYITRRVVRQIIKGGRGGGGLRVGHVYHEDIHDCNFIKKAYKRKSSQTTM